MGFGTDFFFSIQNHLGIFARQIHANLGKLDAALPGAEAGSHFRILLV